MIILIRSIYMKIRFVLPYKGHQFQDIKEVSIDMVRKEKNYIFRNTCEFFYYDYLKNKGSFQTLKKSKKILKKKKKIVIEILFLLIAIQQQPHVLKVV